MHARGWGASAARVIPNAGDISFSAGRLPPLTRRSSPQHNRNTGPQWPPGCCWPHLHIRVPDHHDGPAGADGEHVVEEEAQDASVATGLAG